MGDHRQAHLSLQCNHLALPFSLLPTNCMIFSLEGFTTEEYTTVIVSTIFHYMVHKFKLLTPDKLKSLKKTKVGCQQNPKNDPRTARGDLVPRQATTTTGEDEQMGRALSTRAQIICV